MTRAREEMRRDTMRVVLRAGDLGPNETDSFCNGTTAEKDRDKTKRGIEIFVTACFLGGHCTVVTHLRSIQDAGPGTFGVVRGAQYEYSRRGSAPKERR